MSAGQAEVQGGRDDGEHADQDDPENGAEGSEQLEEGHDLIVRSHPSQLISARCATPVSRGLIGSVGMLRLGGIGVCLGEVDGPVLVLSR